MGLLSRPTWSTSCCLPSRWERLLWWILQVHKSLRIRELLEGAGASVLFLSAYSPDFSLIEQASSKLKNILRKAQARTQEALVEALARAFATVSRRDALGWFEHCGYRVVDQSL